jgi:hypothetical protein
MDVPHTLYKYTTMQVGVAVVSELVRSVPPNIAIYVNSYLGFENSLNFRRTTATRASPYLKNIMVGAHFAPGLYPIVYLPGTRCRAHGPPNLCCQLLLSLPWYPSFFLRVGRLHEWQPAASMLPLLPLFRYLVYYGSLPKPQYVAQQQYVCRQCKDMP